VKVGTQVIHVQKDIAVTENVESWNPDTYMGPLGDRHKSRKDVLAFTPVGMITTALLDFFYAAFLAPGTTIGRSIVGATPTVQVASIAENKTYTWQRGGMSKPPSLQLKPSSTAFGAMEAACIGSAAVQPLSATFWKAAETAALADASFEESSIISDIYKMALGARQTPFDAMGGVAGFEVDFGFMVQDVPMGDVGIADMILKGLGTGVKFAPSNLTESQVDTLLGLQGASAVLPGQAYAKAAEHAVISGTQSGWIFTVKTQGAKNTGRVYAIGEHRFRELVMVNQRTWTAGAADPLFGYTAP
jgi:hypothetical protein